MWTAAGHAGQLAPLQRAIAAAGAPIASSSGRVARGTMAAAVGVGVGVGVGATRGCRGWVPFASGPFGPFKFAGGRQTCQLVGRAT